MDLIKQLRAKAVLVLMSKGQSFKNVSIPEIPADWEKFPGKNDLWKRIDLPIDQNTTACLYQGYSGSLFEPHRHLDNIEHVVILNKGGKVEIITENEIREVCYPNSFCFPKGMAHAVRFLKDTKLMVIWHPAMSEGWQAEFVDSKNVNTTPSNPTE